MGSVFLTGDDKMVAVRTTRGDVAVVQSQHVNRFALEQRLGQLVMFIDPDRAKRISQSPFVDPDRAKRINAHILAVRALSFKLDLCPARNMQVCNAKDLVLKQLQKKRPKSYMDEAGKLPEGNPPSPKIPFTKVVTISEQSPTFVDQWNIATSRLVATKTAVIPVTEKLFTYSESRDHEFSKGMKHDEKYQPNLTFFYTLSARLHKMLFQDIVMPLIKAEMKAKLSISEYALPRNNQPRLSPQWTTNSIYMSDEARADLLINDMSQA
ncbi:hypothetical protein KIN20_035462 [Parelaphostrongylus tenuis]|uniref:Uncharacterized protein n=1 Tax=Parelaphostrongylus tenuis TaxID=148309 RepID=A0AAD5RBP4_PARTN|nr:hypothetical protein KIN20_035462 [Parelaphostrongylus tenuis]